MAQEMVEFPVFLEETNEVVILHLKPEDATRATQDEQFLKNLIYKTQVDHSLEEPIEEALESNTVGREVTPDVLDTKVEGWSESDTLLLLETYRSSEEEFKKNKRHNKIWDKISGNMKLVNPRLSFSGQQCSSKISGLKRTYKHIKEQNKRSGNGRVTWPYYSVMDSIFGEKAYMAPVAIASSEGPVAPDSASSSVPGPSKITNNPKKRRVEAILENFVDLIKEEKKETRRAQEEERQRKEEERLRRDEEKTKQKEKMHQEKMNIQKSLIGLLQKVVEKGN